MRQVTIALITMATLGSAGPATGQYIYLDANGDGRNNSADMLQPGVATDIDVWIVTDRNRDGTSARAVGDVPLSMFSYEFVLHADGGEVEWGDYVNAEPSMFVPFRRRQDTHDLYVGYGGFERLKPGKHRVGRVQVVIRSGAPQISIASESPLEPSLGTSFGSENPGLDADNSIRFGPGGENERRPEAKYAWFDSDGVKSKQAAMASAQTFGPALEFRVTIESNAAPESPVLRISTPRRGPLKVMLFDSRGRLVRALLNEPDAVPGLRIVRLGRGTPSGALPSGIYFYRVHAADRMAHGKVVILH